MENSNSEKIRLITQNIEECLVKEDLEFLVAKKVPLRHYIGFEISGKLHIGSGLMTAMKIKDLIEAGVECSIFLADWHSWLNDKLGGDLKTIKRVAVSYFKEALTQSLICVGANPDRVRFVLGSDFYHNNDEYWQTLIDVSKNLTLARVIKSSTIMGRQEKENQIFARLIYPPMQVADIFAQGVNLAHAGLDQRKAHVIAREVALNLKTKPLKDDEIGIYKPIALHHHLVLGLGKPPTWPIRDRRGLREVWSSMKMSKSDPSSCVFIHDSEEEIKGKILKAFCPEREIEFNPILDWVKHLIFPLRHSLFIERKLEFGGDIEYKNYYELEGDFADGKLHPLDLKNATARALSEILTPARKYFEKPEKKKLIDELDEILKKAGK